MKLHLSQTPEARGRPFRHAWSSALPPTHMCIFTNKKNPPMTVVIYRFWYDIHSFFYLMQSYVIPLIYCSPIKHLTSSFCNLFNSDSLAYPKSGIGDLCYIEWNRSTNRFPSVLSACADLANLHIFVALISHITPEGSYYPVFQHFHIECNISGPKRPKFIGFPWLSIAYWIILVTFRICPS